MSPNYKFRNLKVYSSTEWFANNMKQYRQVFDRQDLDYVYAELSFYNKMFDLEDWDINFTLICYQKLEDDSIKEICKMPFQRTVSKQDNIIYQREGWGNKEAGSFWKKGIYYWEAWIEDQLVGSKYFYIEDTSLLPPKEGNPYIDIKSIKLYEGPYEDLVTEDRRYVKTFDNKDTRYIYVELSLVNHSKDQDWYAEIVTKFYNTSTMELKGEVNRLQPVKKGDSYIDITAGWGSNIKGSWRNGEYAAEIIFMNSAIARINFTIDDKYEYTDELFYIDFIRDEQSDEYQMYFIKVSEDLKTGLQQYLLFFKDYVKSAKNKDITFNVKQVEDGLEVEIQKESDLYVIQDYLSEYLDFAKENFIGIIEVEGEPSTESIDILRMRLEQQVHNLNMEIKYKDLQLKSLEEQVASNKREKLLLIETVNNAIQNNSYDNTTQEEEIPVGEIKSRCLTFIRNDQIDAAFETLMPLSDTKSYQDGASKNLILLNNRWSNFKNKLIINHLSEEIESREKNKIVVDLLTFIGTL